MPDKRRKTIADAATITVVVSIFAWLLFYVTGNSCLPLVGSIAMVLTIILAGVAGPANFGE